MTSVDLLINPPFTLLMIKATKPKTKEKEAPTETTVVISAPSLKAIKSELNFPINPEQSAARKRLASLNNDQRVWEEDLAQYQQNVADAMINIRNAKLAAYKIKKEMPPEVEVTEEAARAMLEEVAALPWIEKLSLIENGSLVLTTRPDSLKTTFDVGVVSVQGNTLEEFLPEPVVVALPQYEIFINLKNIGGTAWSNNSRVLAIKVINKDDVQSFAGAIFGYGQEVHAHWGSAGGGFMTWEKICLGDWENDFVKASYKGLKDMLTELAMYLQVSGDEGAAYRRKHKWAAWLGKPEYNFIMRVGDPDETVAEVQKKYQAEFRKRNQPDKTVPPREHRLHADTELEAENAAIEALNEMAWMQAPQNRAIDVAPLFEGLNNLPQGGLAAFAYTNIQPGGQAIINQPTFVEEDDDYADDEEEEF